MTVLVAPPTVGQAAQALDDFKYDEALRLLPPEAELSECTRDELIRYFSTRALALTNLKRDQEATAAFTRLFSFAPEWTLPDQYGPRVQTMVGQVKANLEGKEARLQFTAGVLKATADAAGLVTGVTVSWKVQGGAVETKRFPVGDVAAPWPGDKPVQAWARLTGLNNSTLLTWGSEAAPNNFVPMVTQAPVQASAGLGPAAFAGMGALAGAVGAAVVGTVFAVSSQDAQKALAVVTRDADGRITSLTQKQAYALDQRASGDATAASVFFVVGVGLAAAGAGLIIYDRASVSPTGTGVALSVPLDATFGFAGVSR